MLIAGKVRGPFSESYHFLTNFLLITHPKFVKCDIIKVENETSTQRRKER